MMMKRYRRSVALLAALTVAAGGCNLDLNDPNFPPEEVVFSDPEGLKAVAVGLQAEYANQIVDPIYVVGLVTDELGAGASTFANFQAAEAGRELDPATDVSEGPFRGHYRVIKLANDLLTAVPDARMAEGTKSGIIALSRLIKAMALGHLIMLYEQIPLDVGINNPAPTFVDRQTVLSEILRLLQEARTQINTTPVSTEFTSDVLAPGFNLENTINAMLARYSLVAGDYTQAIEAAQRVDLSVRSEFRFSANDPNSIFQLMYRSGNAFQLRPRQSFRQQAEAGDRRVAFWVTPANVSGAAGPLDELRQYRALDAPFPVYIADEMRLIMAEAYARLGNLEPARTLVNAVRTQCPPAGVDPIEPMPCLPPLSAAELPTQQAVLNEILQQRRYELFLQGVRFEDLRRFGQPLKYEFIPYPTSECERNPNTPRGAQPWQCR
ncbi:MAG TPA: RagB/SusD family nutrient uptake outer membrane protein [Longimicrobiaceae bacterium]|nr:RagB/SusD family nutrient uptake outer membrane protein [Longimicrobiaceae bacterium]